MKKAFLVLSLLVSALVVNAEPGDRDRDGRRGPGPGRGQCRQMENFFDFGLRQCWKTRQTGCIQYLVAVIPANDLTECKPDLYTQCFATCYSVWGVNDSGCNQGCTQHFKP